MAVVSLAGHWGPEGLEYPDGRHARNAPVAILRPDYTTPPLYVDRHRTATVPNPTASDEYGNLSFYADPGSYIMRVFGIDIPVTVNENPGERSEQESAVLAAPVGVPLVLYKGPTGILTYSPQAPTAPRWGNEFRVSDAPPAVSEIAPLGAVHLDLTTARYYRYMEV